MNNDPEHLNLLSFFHYVAAGLTALFACFPFIHLAIGIAMLAGSFDDRNAPPQFLGWLFVAGAGFFILCGWTMALLMVLAGHRLKRRTAWTFCFVVAIMECLLMPYGTVLGVFTLVVLGRPSAKALFSPSLAPIGHAQS